MSDQLFEGIALSYLFQHYASHRSTCQRRVPRIRRRVDEAVRILNTTTGVKVCQAMILAGFPKKETTNETVHRMIHHHLEALEAKQMTPRRDAPTVEEVRIVPNNDADLLPLTGEDDDPTASATMTTTTTGPTHPKPTRKHIRATASTVQQRRIQKQG
jgi:hypothetical protein